MNPNIINALLGVWASLRAEHQLFWTFHWRSKGTPYYADHLMFQRLYEARVEEIDRMGEVVMALGGPSAVDPVRSWIGVKDVIDRTVEAAGLSDVQKSIGLVRDTLARIDAANTILGDSPYALAVNNVLAGIADKHLEALYLLQQRAA
jgi:DNA-binding ferritin-like protein